MIYTIIRKETLEIIQTKIFLFAFVFMLIISAVCSFVLVDDFNEKKSENIEYRISHERILDFTTPGRLGGMLLAPVRPLPKLSMLFHGVNDFFGMPSIDRDSVVRLFPPTDFFLIIGIFMSLLAIMFSFSAVSGEKEEGTLRAIFSNPLKRAKLLIGKWIGGVISLSIPFSACYIFAILVVILRADIILGTTEGLSLFLIYILGLIYISLFYLIGLYVSAKTKEPHISMLAALLIWAFLVLVMPTLPDYLGKEIFTAPSMTKFIYDTELRWEHERKTVLRKIRKPYVEQGYNWMEAESMAKEEIAKAMKPL
ncbi:ABC transporter permease subunit, partial [bacterium]|nr:ABC transporter permease subunit [bacterium]